MNRQGHQAAHVLAKGGPLSLAFRSLAAGMRAARKCARLPAIGRQVCTVGPWARFCCELFKPAQMAMFNSNRKCARIWWSVQWPSQLPPPPYISIQMPARRRCRRWGSSKAWRGNLLVCGWRRAAGLAMRIVTRLRAGAPEGAAQANLRRQLGALFSSWPSLSSPLARPPHMRAPQAAPTSHERRQISHPRHRAQCVAWTSKFSFPLKSLGSKASCIQIVRLHSSRPVRPSRPDKIEVFAVNKLAVHEICPNCRSQSVRVYECGAGCACAPIGWTPTALLALPLAAFGRLSRVEICAKWRLVPRLWQLGRVPGWPPRQITARARLSFHTRASRSSRHHVQPSQFSLLVLSRQGAAGWQSRPLRASSPNGETRRPSEGNIEWCSISRCIAFHCT